MESQIKGWLCKVPMILLLVATFFAGIYAAFIEINGINFATPIFIGIILVFYALGEYYHQKNLKVAF